MGASKRRKVLYQIVCPVFLKALVLSLLCSTGLAFCPSKLAGTFSGQATSELESTIQLCFSHTTQQSQHCVIAADSDGDHVNDLDIIPYNGLCLGSAIGEGRDS